MTKDALQRFCEVDFNDVESIRLWLKEKSELHGEDWNEENFKRFIGQSDE